MADPMVDFGKAKILVVGDLFLDRFVYGDVDRISPEAPVPVLRQTKSTTALGGAGNVALNIASLGASVRLIAAVGDDKAGNAARGLIDGSDLIVIEGHITAVKTRYIAGHQQVLRVDEEAPTPVFGVDIESRAKQEIQDCDIVVLSDYDKGVLTDKSAQAIIGMASKADKRVICDPHTGDWVRYRWSDYITPNRSELDAAARSTVQGDASITAECRKLICRYGLRGVIATRSEEGLSVITETAAEHIGTCAREVFDVSGAGDTVVAVLACGLASGMELTEAARVANVAAGIVVGKLGTAVVTMDDLGCPSDDVFARVRRWRSGGLRIGFTNGCFDILHAGHVATLEFAKSRCDRLVVGLNSDSSVMRLKGETRPFNVAADRAAVIGALSAVDVVVVFEEDTPADLVKALKPDVMVKGGDYDSEILAGSGHAGEVAIGPFIDGKSSTDLIEQCSGTM